MKHPADLKISDFTYELPEARIAAFPRADRSASRLLDAAADGLHNRIFSELPELLESGSVLMYN
ncbi:MAG: tRNA preQ1(34) S-adenosylmethionine ribosyltransferase-isomerase QueA, partial [Bacteroidetes bacterium]|nr:tRNA preQ1(34) S-adenosylmethionine ribosyltransferase-isomerase QueA [Bacteroidota bacterium]